MNSAMNSAMVSKMNFKANRHLITATFMVLATLVFTGAYAQPQDQQNYRGIPSAFKNVAIQDRDAKNRRDRRGSYHGVERNEVERRFNRANRNYREANRNNRRQSFGQYSNRRLPNARREASFFSYTSPPLRGGSSRRTRIIENPYSDRLVTGITLTGIDNDPVHIRDVVAYPGRQRLSPLRYSLSQYSPPRFINTYDYIDYISVAAKRKEYFTVTFHYD
ncbi:MAG: hypothetical protein AB8B95_05105 [Pseudohongiellaceae bacterium]